MGLPKFPVMVMAIWVIAGSGCLSQKLLPAMDQMVEGHKFPVLSISHSVALITPARFANQQIKVCSGRWRNYVVDSADLILSAEVFLKKILVANRIVVHENGTKRIAITWADASCRMGFWVMEYVVSLDVRVGGSIVKRFEGHQTIGHEKAADWAIEKALAGSVLAMLEDSEIRHYLQSDP